MQKTKTDKSNPFARYVKMGAGLLSLAILALGGLMLSQQPSVAADVVVYKSPTCGCCEKWVEHLQENGFSVQVHDHYDMNPIKSELGVPSRLRSCHTAKVGDYLVEGHVPAADIARLLQEKPPVKGLSVPGMPMGSPGMEGPRKDAFQVLTFDTQGHTSIYANR